MTIGDYLRDVGDTWSLSPSNPIVDAIQGGQPDFARMRPNHLVVASSKVQEEYDAAIASIEQKLDEGETIDDLVVALEEVRIPILMARNLGRLFCVMDPSEPKWTRAHEQMDVTQKLDRSKRILQELESLQNPSWQAKDLIRRHRNAGAHLDEKASLSLWQTRNKKISVGSFFIPPEEIDSYENVPSIKSILQNLHTFSTLATREAELLGYATPVVQHFDNRLFTPEQVSEFQREISSRANEALNAMPKQKDEKEENVDMRAYLSLDGTLGAAFALANVLFGVSVREEKKIKAWYPQDVRLFHFHDEDSGELLGSCYLDPFFRPRKSRRTRTISIAESPALSCVTTSVSSAPWDHLATQISVTEAASVFHEFGHVLALVLAKDSGVRGASNIPIETSKVLPRVRRGCYIVMMF